MPNYKASAIARHAYLLSRFQPSPYPGDRTGRVEFRFCGNLPRATTLTEAINTALREEGIAIPDGAVEVSLEKAHEINHLRSLFVSAAPETVLLDGRIETVYAFGCIKSFRANEGSSSAAVIEYASLSSLVVPSPIAGIRSDPDGLYSLLHTALRKIADSKITSAAWNAMHVIDSDTRAWLTGIVSGALNGKTYDTSEDVVKAVKVAFVADETSMRNPARQMMACIFSVFDDNDWAGMLSFCMIWPHEVLANPAPITANTEV
jgi:hypothetical protein